jgi:hypothetical protein
VKFSEIKEWLYMFIGILFFVTFVSFYSDNGSIGGCMDSCAGKEIRLFCESRPMEGSFVGFLSDCSYICIGIHTNICDDLPLPHAWVNPLHYFLEGAYVLLPAGAVIAVMAVAYRWAKGRRK